MSEATILTDPVDGIQLVNGKPYMADAKGSLVPVDAIKAADKLEDETVRKIVGFARDLSDQIARFRGHTFTDLGEFDALLEQEYEARPRGGRHQRPSDFLQHPHERRRMSDHPLAIDGSILDVTTIVPRERHPLIFASFDGLEPGQSFELQNDHDPKPLRYQFEAEHSGRFTWDYLEEGPDRWRVRIGKS